MPALQIRVRAVCKSSLLYLGLWSLVLLLLLRFTLFSISAATRPSHGFVAYYTAAQLVRRGANVNRFYDDDWFRAQTEAQQPAASDIYNVNLPTTALLLLPLAGLSYTGARVIWTLFNLVCLIGAGGWLLQQAGLRGLWGLGFIAFTLLYQPLYANFRLGQAYVLLFGLLVMAWYGYRSRRPGILGVSLGLMLALKTAGILLWPLLLIRRRWRALMWGVASVLVVVLVSLPWLGLEAWQTYFHLLPGLNARPEMAVTAYQTQLSFVRHLFTFDARWNPAPLLPASALGIWLPWVSFAVLAGLSAYWAHTMQQADLVFAAFVVANVILSPVSVDYHYTLLLVPIAVLLAWARTQMSRRLWIVLGAAISLIAADLPYRSLQQAEGARALLAYPKLYGAWLLWGLAWWACHQKTPQPSVSMKEVGV